MSADNTIAVVKFDDWYRVAHIQAAENINARDWDLREKYIDGNFWDCKVFKERSEAVEYGFWLEDSIWYVEYWVSVYEIDWYIQKRLSRPLSLYNTQWT